MYNVIRLVFFYSRERARSRHPIHCRGQTLVEYALILSIISIVIVGVIFNLGLQVKGVYSTIESQVGGAAGAAASTH